MPSIRWIHKSTRGKFVFDTMAPAPTTSSADLGTPTRQHLTPKRRRPGRPAGRPAGAPTVTDREQLLAAAERLIAASGPAVSMEAVASEAGVTKPILYQHVGNRDALIEALAARHVRRINVAVDAATGSASDPRDRVRRFVNAFFHVVEQDRNLYLFLANGGSGDTWSHRALLFADQAAGPLAKVLARQRIAEGADPAVANTWAYGLVGLLHYVTLWWIREPVLSTDEVVDHVIELLWGGLGTPAANRSQS